MTVFSTTVAILSIVVCAFNGLGQTKEIEDNWFYMGGTHCGPGPISYKYDNYSPEDVIKAKRHLESIRAIGFADEWEGVYSRAGAGGDNQMVWNATGGFFEFACNDHLESFDFGAVKFTSDDLIRTSEKPGGDSKSESLESLVKIRSGGIHLLVPAKLVQDFCLGIVGRSIQRNKASLWVKFDDLTKPVLGLPCELPNAYRKFVAKPIETTISIIGPKDPFVGPGLKTIKTLNWLWLTISAGMGDGVLPGMYFYVDELREWIFIQSTNRSMSLGFIQRRFDVDLRKDICSDVETNAPFECKKPRVGMKARTKFDPRRF